MATSMNMRRFWQISARKCVNRRYDLPVGLASTSQMRLRSTLPNVSSENDVEIPEYPPIKPKFPPGKWDDNLDTTLCWKYHERGEELKTIPVLKERLEKMADSPKYMWRVSPFERATGSLPYMQYITKTHTINGIPGHVYNDVKVESIYEQIKSVVSDALVQEHEQLREYGRPGLNVGENLRRRVFPALTDVRNIIHSILSCTAAENEQLLRAQLDEKVDVKTFWKRNGFKGSDGMSARGKFSGILALQYEHKADFQIRTELPLPQFISPEDDLCLKGDYPGINYVPKGVGQIGVFQKPRTVSGHWVGDPCEFGLASFHVLPEFQRFDTVLKEYRQRSDEETWTKFGMLASFGWCAAQAHNQGFNWISDITYPFTTQTILTDDGKTMQFFAYQLNTLRLWQDDSANPLRNILWKSPKMRLYDTIESGQVKGLNDDALKQIMRFMLLKPVHPGVELRPYLQEESPVNKKLYINHVGDEPLQHPVIGRWQYPRQAVYF